MNLFPTCVDERKPDNPDLRHALALSAKIIVTRITFIKVLPYLQKILFVSNKIM